MGLDVSRISLTALFWSPATRYDSSQDFEQKNFFWLNRKRQIFDEILLSAEFQMEPPVT